MIFVVDMEMICTQKPVMTKEQLAKCDSCEWITGKKCWCCSHGFWVRPRTTTPRKKIIIPEKKVIIPPTKLQMAASFAKAMIQWGASGFKCVSKAEYMKRITECYKCDSRAICPYCRCRMKAKVVLATAKCPENKW